MPLKKILIALIVVIALLFVALVEVMWSRSQKTEIPVAASLTQQKASTPAAKNQASTETVFDPATATKADGTPKSHVEKYFTAIVKGDFATAFKLLPLEKQAGGEQAFATQLKSYNMTGYKINEVKAGDTEQSIEATAKTAGGDFTYEWSFVKYNGSWLLKSRTLAGMGQ